MKVSLRVPRPQSPDADHSLTGPARPQPSFCLETYIDYPTLGRMSSGKFFFLDYLLSLWYDSVMRYSRRFTLPPGDVIEGAKETIVTWFLLFVFVVVLGFVLIFLDFLWPT